MPPRRQQSRANRAKRLADKRKYLDIACLDDASLLGIFSHLDEWWDRMRAAHACHRWRELLLSPGSRDQWRDVQVRLMFGGQEEIWTNLHMRGILDFFLARRDWFTDLSLVLDMETDLAEDGVLCVALLFGLLGLIGSSLRKLELVLCEPAPDQRYYDEQDRRERAGLAFDTSDPWEYTARTSAKDAGVNMTALMDNCGYFSLIPNLIHLEIRGERFPQPWFLPKSIEHLALDGGQRAADALTAVVPQEHTVSSLGTLQRLQSLELPEFCLHEQHAWCLSTLSNLRRLSLERVHFHAYLEPPAEGEPVFPELQGLDLSESSVAEGLVFEDCIRFMAGSKKLSWLSLRGCGMTRLPACAVDLPLETLLLGGNRLTDEDYLPQGRYLGTLRVLGLSSAERFGAKNKYPPEDGAFASDGDDDDWYTDEGDSNEDMAMTDGDSRSDSESSYALSVDGNRIRHSGSDDESDWTTDTSPSDEEGGASSSSVPAPAPSTTTEQPPARDEIPNEAADGAVPARRDPPRETARRDASARAQTGRGSRATTEADRGAAARALHDEKSTRVILKRSEDERIDDAELFARIAERLMGNTPHLETLRINMNPRLLYSDLALQDLVSGKPHFRRLEVSSSFWDSPDEMKEAERQFPSISFVEV